MKFWFMPVFMPADADGDRVIADVDLDTMKTTSYDQTSSDGDDTSKSDDDDKDDKSSKQTRDADGKFAKSDDDADKGDDSTSKSDADAKSDDADASDKGEDGNDDETAAKPPRLQSRINELTAQKNRYRDQVTALQAKLDNLQKTADEEVDPDTYEDPDEYAEKRLEKVLAKRDVEAAKEAAASAKQSELVSSYEMFQTRVDAVREYMPDFDDKFGDDVAVSELGVHFLGESEKGPAVAMYLADNKAEAERIAALPEAQQGIALARIEAKVKMPTGRKQTAAPAPPKTVKGGGGTTSGVFDANAASIDEMQKHLYPS